MTYSPSVHGRDDPELPAAPWARRRAARTAAEQNRQLAALEELMVQEGQVDRSSLIHARALARAQQAKKQADQDDASDPA